jgi:hypothetical protein
MSDVGFQRSDVGCPISDFGFRISDFGFRMMDWKLEIRFWILDVRCKMKNWKLEIGNCLFWNRGAIGREIRLLRRRPNKMKENLLGQIIIRIRN